jgi:hypothetical protein
LLSVVTREEWGFIKSYIKVDNRVVTTGHIILVCQIPSQSKVWYNWSLWVHEILSFKTFALVAWPWLWQVKSKTGFSHTDRVVIWHVFVYRYHPFWW